MLTPTFVQTESFRIATYQWGDPESETLVLMMPGKLDSGQYKNFVVHGERLWAAGYFAVSFDPPGSWESWRDENMYTTTNYRKAIDELIAYFGDRKTVTIGHSRWWTMSTLAGVTNTAVVGFGNVVWKYTCDPDFVWAASFPDPEWEAAWYQTTERDDPPGWWPKDRVIMIPYAFLVDAIQHDEKEKLSTCTKPKFFVAWEQDTLATVDMVKAGYGIAAEPKKFHTIDRWHDWRDSDEMIDEVYGFIVELLEEVR